VKIFSPAFSEGASIPIKYTCDGKGISIPLQWQDVPSEARSLALIMDDPDAPMGTWVHWVVYNLPIDQSELTEGQPADQVLPGGAIQGPNTSGKTGYSGPCPPDREHRYFFKLYALDKDVESKPGLTKAALLEAMQGHILADCQTFGVYDRR
jgi:Raf kinase inhibitor-like YbhB/YbcL family protein